jgi:hypothetical protein
VADVGPASHLRSNYGDIKEEPAKVYPCLLRKIETSIKETIEHWLEL